MYSYILLPLLIDISLILKKGYIPKNTYGWDRLLFIYFYNILRRICNNLFAMTIIILLFAINYHYYNFHNTTCEYFTPAFADGH